MNRLTTALALLACLMPTITLAQDVGIVTSCERDDNPISNDTVFAALCTGKGAAWNVFTLGYTGLFDNVVVWGVSGINPDVELPLGNYYKFYAKHPRGGSQGFYYSHWSDTVYYGVADTFIPVVLDLDTTDYPWGAPGSMDTCSDGCSMKPEVKFGDRETDTQDLHA